MRIGQLVLSVIAGSAVFMIIHLAGLGLLGYLWPMPEGTDPQNVESMKLAIAAMPILAFVALLASYFVATAAGSFVAALICGNDGRHLAASMTVGLLFTVAAVMNLATVPHPVWFVALNVPEFMIAAGLGWRLSRARLRHL
ncbi:MAG: hypothetical protein EXS00_07605 [Phycisphaerales bacterium]|nr:hypothetical protein [Phycisphaerales bacterium]